MAPPPLSSRRISMALLGVMETESCSSRHAATEENVCARTHAHTHTRTHAHTHTHTHNETLSICLSTIWRQRVAEAEMLQLRRMYVHARTHTRTHAHTHTHTHTHTMKLSPYVSL